MPVGMLNRRWGWGLLSACAVSAAGAGMTTFRDPGSQPVLMPAVAAADATDSPGGANGGVDDLAPSTVSDQEMIFTSPSRFQMLQVWDNLRARYIVCADRPVQISVPFRNNISDLPPGVAMEMFDSSQLKYTKILPNVACIEFHDSTEKWFLYYTGARSGSYMIYRMMYDDPLSGIHEFYGVGAFRIVPHPADSR